MFQGCISLKELHLPKDVTEIEDFAFYNASNLKKITIPSSISKLGLSIIEGCASLDSLTIPHNVKEWNKLGKSGVNTIIIENGVSYIPREAFFACDELKTLIIPKSVTYINNAFSYGGLKEIYIDDLNQWLNYNWYNPNYPFEASGRGFVNGEIVRDTGFNEMGKLYINGNLLTNLSLPNNIEIVPAYAFHGCSSIETIEIPNNIIEIEQSAFAGTQIEEISIPNSVHKMGDAIFRSCYNLKKVNLPNNITEFPGGFLADCSSLTEFTIPDYIERLGSGVFSCCDNLKTVKLSQKLTSIPSNAFYACKQLDIIEIPNSVSSIFDYSFAYCKSLKSISIPENVKFIESYAFEATPLEKVYCYAQTPPTISSHHVFDKATNLILYVPKNCKDAYKSSKWNMYFDKIYEIEK
ncbi:MAG: leucine-rich repeat protein [Bacteroides sp.]